MESIKNKLDDAISIFKKRKKHTNCYLNYNQFLQMINKEEFIIVNNNLFILKRYDNILKFLYFVDDLKDIKLAKVFLENVTKEISLEFLSKGEINNNTFINSEFKLYRIFSRYMFTQEKRNNIKKTANVHVADKNDILEIKDIISQVFDPLCDFIPTIQELEHFVDNKELNVIKNEEKLLGFAIYVRETYGYDFRLSCVNPQYQYGLAGYSLLSHIPEGGSKNICWIDDNNLPAIRLNTSIGFKKDGLKNYIFVRNNKN